jgi:hypothetical protein
MSNAGDWKEYEAMQGELVDPPETITLTYEQYENLHYDVEKYWREVDMLTKALDHLKGAAKRVIDNRELIADDNKLQDWIEELYEAMPCNDCLQSPCCCAAIEQAYERSLEGR